MTKKLAPYERFKETVKVRGWTVRQLRSDDAPPNEDLLAFMDSVGLDRYERWVLWYEAEQRGARS